MKEENDKKKNYLLIAGAIVIILLLCCGLMFFAELTPSIGGGAVAILSAIIGVVITIVITAALLNRQSDQQSKLQVLLLDKQYISELKKERDVKVFEEKLKIYKEFLSKLHDIIKDDKISEYEVKELIFQISYIAMHTSSEHVNTILLNLNKTITGIGKNEKGKTELAQNVLDIVLVLQRELYNEKLGNNDIKIKLFSGLVTDINDFAESDGNENSLVFQSYLPETNEEKILIQTYFWKELLKQLKQINPEYVQNELTDETIAENVSEYYARKRNRHRFYGFAFEVYTSKKDNRKVYFTVEIENDYYYGFLWNDSIQSDELLSNIVIEVSDKYNSNQY